MGKLLILGGTTEARQLAEALAARDDLAVTLSLAGRTLAPAAMPVPVRVGGFGGAEGLARYLSDEAIDLLVDATHPFASRISANAAEAARLSGVASLALRRPAWDQQPGDQWTLCDTLQQAIAALGEEPRRVLLALGRQEAHVAEHAPHHHYWVRSVDPIVPPLRVPHATSLLARGPFAFEEDRALLQAHGIEALVCKNSGGAAAYAKIDAARALGLPVMIVRQPAPSALPQVESVAEALAAIEAHRALRGL